MCVDTSGLRWYVFDYHDCLDHYSFNGYYEAMGSAVKLVNEGFKGIEVKCMTSAGFNAYCKSVADYERFVKQDQE